MWGVWKWGFHVIEHIWQWKVLDQITDQSLSYHQWRCYCLIFVLLLRLRTVELRVMSKNILLRGLSVFKCSSRELLTSLRFGAVHLSGWTPNYAWRKPITDGNTLARIRIPRWTCQMCFKSSFSRKLNGFQLAIRTSPTRLQYPTTSKSTAQHKQTPW